LKNDGGTEAPAPSLTGALRQLFETLSRARRRQLVALFLLMLAGAGAEVAVIGSVVPFLAMLTGQSASVPRLFGGLAYSPAVAVAFIAAVLIAAAIRLLLARSSQRFTAGVAHDLAMATQRRILDQPYSFHVQRHSSEMVASLEKVHLVAFGVIQQALTTAVALVVGLVLLLFLIAIDPKASLVAFASLGLVYLAISRAVSGRFARFSDIFSTTYDDRIKLVQESLGGIRDLIIDQSQPAYLESFRKSDERFTRALADSIFLAGLPRYLIEPAAVVVVAGLAILLAVRAGGIGAAIPVLGAIALGGLRLLPLMQQAYSGWASMAANRGVVGQVLELLHLPLREEASAAEPLPFRDAITLRGLTLTYPGRSEPALEGISLRIGRGERVALTGETGSGKSSLADLIMGLLQPDTGSVEIDGVGLTAANLRAWQRNVAHVSQSIFLADATIARNIAFGIPNQPIDMDRVRKSAEQAEIAGFIDSLPQGFETIAGERGARLSGGQRQRIAIARALYKAAPLLVLDEATNALDEATEARILDTLFVDKGLTILIIGHRPSALRHCGRVVRLSGGRIVDPA
jgi:ATP-binding cassette subfamily B protein